MNFDALIPITLFVCIFLSIKAVIDARARRQMLQSNGSEDMLRTIVEGEELRRRQSSLRWGVILVALAAGFGLLEAFNWREASPGLVAILLGATGLGNLAAYYIARRAK